jgi:uncharacterized protein YcfL
MKYTFAFLLVIFTLIQISCGSHSEINSQHSKKFILVTYKVDTTQQNIINNYQVVFLGKNKILPCQTNKDTLIIPNQNLLTDSTYNVKFVFYDTINFLFKDVDKRVLIPDQNMTWMIGTDSKPFDNMIGYELEKSDSNKVKKIIYWGFDLHEFGDGIVFIQKE